MPFRYLIWLGATTSESFKWTDWKDDIAHDEAYIASDPSPRRTSTEYPGSFNGKAWPIKSDKIMYRVENQEDFNNLDHGLKWEKVGSMKEVVNIYDIGFWRSLQLIFW